MTSSRSTSGSPQAKGNRRFGVSRRNPADAHRKVLHDGRELDLILCEQHIRKVKRNLSISFEGRT